MTAAKKVWYGNDGLRRTTVPIGDLAPHPKNPRRGVTVEIQKSLDRFGQQRPILALPDGTIVAGHHVWYAAKDAGWTHVSVVRSDLTDAEVDGYLVADNRTAEIGVTDQSALAEILREQYEAGRLEGTGYTPDDYDDLMADLDRIATSAQEDFKGNYAETEEERAARERSASAGATLREIVLTFDDAQFQDVSRWIKMLRKEYETSGVADTVYEGIKRAASTL